MRSNLGKETGKLGKRLSERELSGIERESSGRGKEFRRETRESGGDLARVTVSTWGRVSGRILYRRIAGSRGNLVTHTALGCHLLLFGARLAQRKWVR